MKAKINATAAIIRSAAVKSLTSPGKTQSSNIWRIYLSVNVISMRDSDNQHEGMSIGSISIDYTHVRANKSSLPAVIIIKVIPKLVKKSDKAIFMSGVFTLC